MTRFEEFLVQARTDDELGAGMRAMFEDESIKDKKQGLIDYGKAHGYEFGVEEMKDFAEKLNADDVELSEYELDAVAGGSKSGVKAFFSDFDKGFRAGIVSIVSSLGLCFAD